MTDTASQLANAANAALTGRWFVPAVLLCALVVRLLWLTLWTGAIDTEGAEYARIAENLLSGHGYAGIATPGTELMLPPFFPILIAAVSLLVHDAQLAGQIVSLLMGTLMVLLIYRIAFLMYGTAAASISALLAA